MIFHLSNAIGSRLNTVTDQFRTLNSAFESCCSSLSSVDYADGSGGKQIVRTVISGRIIPQHNI